VHVSIEAFLVHHPNRAGKLEREETRDRARRKTTTIKLTGFSRPAATPLIVAPTLVELPMFVAAPPCLCQPRKDDDDETIIL
jgi:hypothetical protein